MSLVSLYIKNLLSQFYKYKKDELQYESYKVRVKLFEDFLMQSALFSYIDYLNLKNKQKEINHSISLLQTYIDSLEQYAKFNLLAKITLSDLNIEKSDKEIQKKNNYLGLIQKKMKLASYIGEKVDNISFEDTEIINDDPIEKFIAYQESSFTKQIEQDKLRLKLAQVVLKENKNLLHPYIKLFVNARSDKQTEKFFDSFNHFKNTENKNYSIGIKSGITIFNKPDRFKILETKLQVKKFKQYLNYSIISNTQYFIYINRAERNTENKGLNIK